jgi:succinyl-diaminopimelate desuccinylase
LAPAPAQKPSLEDPVALTQALVRCPSVTPQEAGALELVETLLSEAGFTVWRLPFGQVDNLYALRRGGPFHLMFAGHVDVVPVGEAAAWTHPPFGAEIHDGWLYGRGAEDMKGNIAAALVAAQDYLAQESAPITLSFLLTSDEEGPAIDGTRRVVDWLKREGIQPDACLNLEPTARERPGDLLKIGRRGSLSAQLSSRGRQGHVGYPQDADNPLPDLARFALALCSEPLDKGTEHFEPSNLELTSLDVGNKTFNLIPASASLRFNVRFNETWRHETLKAELQRRLDSVGRAYQLEWQESAEAFLSPPKSLAQPLARLIEHLLGAAPLLSTAGGTSDARFIRTLCPVVDLGLPARSLHQVDERISVQELVQFSTLLRQIIARLPASIQASELDGPG